MKIVCIGGGPAGLYCAISMKLRNPTHEVLVIERNRPDDTFGWGVVFSNETLDQLWRNDPDSAAAIEASFQHWDDIDVHFKGHVVRSGGHGFAGIARRRLLNLLQERARALGVQLRFECEVEDLDADRDADLIVAADGSSSRIRSRYAAAFKPSIELRNNKYIWLGTRKSFEAFTFIFEETEHGWIWAHAYRFDGGTSTFIVECGEATWRALGFDQMSEADGIAACEMLFERHLEGQRLISNAAHLRGSAWLNFARVTCERWYHGNIVLVGDAAHTAHFSIGSGTKLALEDAIALADALHAQKEIEGALAAYQETRRIEVLKLQSAARNSTEWFEAVPRYVRFEPMQFAYALLTRSQRVSHENLRLRDRTWLENMERWFAERASRRGVQMAVPPMFTPFRLRELELANRIAVSPMAMYSAEGGVAGDFHLVHLGTRAQGGAGLVFTEMTCVSPEGRITPGCAGMYKNEHVVAWTRIVDFVHRHTDAKVCLQLGHSGPKGSTKLGWEGMDEPLHEGNWEVIGPSPVPWSPNNQVPRPMALADMDDVLAAFVRATEMAQACGFDMVELHCAHGYLLSAFITPLMNRRIDPYGGPLENRLRFPLEVFAAMRAVWPEHKPISVRISATDWVEGGITGDDAVEIAGAFAAAGADIIDVSAGQTSTHAKPIYGRMFQTPFADRIRNEAGIATMAVGNIFDPDHVNSIIAAGRADLCCLARPHLADPVLVTACRRAARLRAGRLASAVSVGSGAVRAQSEARGGPNDLGMSAAMAGVLDGRHAVVTGGGRGIGAAVATALATKGAKVTLLGRNEAQLKERSETLPVAQAIRCDVTDEAAVGAAFAEGTRAFGPVAILVNNAGAAESAPLGRTSLELLRRMLDVNLIGTFLCSRTALPDMLEAGFGRIVNVASIAGLKGAAYVSAYCAAKHGVVGLTRALALETATKGVTVNAVCPSYTDTEMARRAIANIVAKTGRSAADAEMELVRKNPLGRLIRPEEVAATVLWLCVPGSEAITGQTIAIAGGEVM